MPWLPALASQLVLALLSVSEITISTDLTVSHPASHNVTAETGYIGNVAHIHIMPSILKSASHHSYHSLHCDVDSITAGISVKCHSQHQQHGTIASTTASLPTYHHCVPAHISITAGISIVATHSITASIGITMHMLYQLESKGLQLCECTQLNTTNIMIS